MHVFFRKGFDAFARFVCQTTFWKEQERGLRVFMVSTNLNTSRGDPEFFGDRRGELALQSFDL